MRVLPGCHKLSLPYPAMAPSFLERHPFRRIQSSNCITFLKALKLRGVESQTVAAIRDLKTTVQVIRNAFVEVETDIRRFAEISSEDPDGGIMIEDLCTQWRELYIVRTTFSTGDI